MPFPPPFLAAAWRRPLLLSWHIPADALLPLLPAGLALDCWQGRAYISLVGLCFADTRIWGIPAWPRRYAEVNLRFYVRRTAADDYAPDDDYDAPDCRRPAPGVVFIRQIVPHRITAVAARRLYGEPFIHRPVRCQTDPSGAVAYRWRGASAGASRRWHTFQAQPSAIADAPPAAAAPGSLDEFLTDRYWGYNGKPGGPTRAYQLTRSPLQLRPADARIDADLTSEYGIGEYGAALAAAMSRPPASALLASDCRARIRLPRRL